MVILLRIFNKFCPVSCTDSNLSPLNFVQIYASFEFGIIVLVLLHYLGIFCNLLNIHLLNFFLVLTLKFNKMKKLPDINQEMERPFFSTAQLKDLGYKDKSYLSTILENQADMLRYLQEKNETLTQKLYQQNQTTLPNIN